MPEFANQFCVICKSPRSGSTMLRKDLSATGIAVNQGAHFHEPSIGAWLQYYDFNEQYFSSEREPLNAIFAAACTVGEGNSDIFGLRLQRHSFQFFVDQIELLQPGKATDRERTETVLVLYSSSIGDGTARTKRYHGSEQSGTAILRCLG